MANSTASIIIKSTVTFNCGDTFVFNSWVCTADGAGLFQCYLTMTPDPEIVLMTLPEVVTCQLVEKFDEFSLYNQVADFEMGSTSNSNSTLPWIEPRELTLEPSCEPVLPHEHFPYDLCNSSKAYAEALTSRRVGKEIVSEYSLDSNTVPDYNSDSSYEFNFGSDPIKSESELNTTEEPLSGPAAGLVITSTPAGKFVYWPNRKPADLIDNNSHGVAYLVSLPFQEEIPLTPNEDEHAPTEVATTNSGFCTPDREVFMETGEAGTSENIVDRYLKDISEDKESAKSPAHETTDAKNARCEWNRKRVDRRKRLREALPIRNLNEALDQVTNRVHTTPR
jgi:hypothetical protein